MGWLLAGVATIIASLSTAVTFLYRVVQSGNSKRIEEMQAEINLLREDQKRLDKLNEECIADRARLTVEVNFLKKRLGENGDAQA